jgi:glycosyltransferase involved in cell wall biosynthesis
MRIIQLIQKPQRRGAEIFAAQLGEKLRSLGHEVTLVSIFKGGDELSFNGKWIKLNRPISIRFFDLMGWKQFAEVVKDLQPHVIQANAADTLKFSVFSKIIFGWEEPIIYRNANQMGDFIKGSLHRRFNQLLINRVTKVISVSEASRRDLHETFNFPPKQSIHIPIAIDTDAIDAALSEQVAVELPKNFIIQIGSLVSEKDPIGMLRMFQDMAKFHPNLHLVFLGSGKELSRLQAEINLSNLDQTVHIIPPQTNIFPILSKSKALVMPSKIEGLPGVILEAMYCHIPVISYDVGGISEAINSTTGWLIPSGDTDKFKEAVVKVLNSDQNHLLAHASVYIKNNYSIASVTKRFECFYENLH